MIRILIDQNISHRIIPKISTTFSAVEHVRNLGLQQASDYEIFLQARGQQFDAILTIDEDFLNLIQVFGSPPKIIWLRLGNCQTDYIASVLVAYREQIESFMLNDELKILQIFKP